MSKRRKTAEQKAYERLEKDGDKWAAVLYHAHARAGNL